MKYRVLIIDDERADREATYEKLFSDSFDFKIVSRQDEYKKENLDNYDAFFVDLNLEKGFVTISLTEILRSLKSKPIVLISGSWTHTERIPLLINGILEEVPECNVISSMVYQGYVEGANSFISHYQKSVCTTIQFALNKYYQQTTISIDDNQEIGILHLSDPQFGDPNFDALSYLAEKDIKKAIEGNKVNFVVISGDIAYSGLPEQFDKATIWIKKLLADLFPDDPSRHTRLLLVPGNHDVNLGLLAADSVKYSFSTKEYTLENHQTHQHNAYGLNVFRNFAFKVTKDLEWLTNPDLCFYNNRFIYHGLQFIHLNSANELSSQEPSYASLPKNDLLNNTPTNQENIFTIAISHHGPKFSNDPYEVSIGNWDESKKILQHSKASLLIHGHGHQKVIEKLREAEVANIVRVMAATSHLNGKVRPSDERRGFNLISLMRKDKVVTSFTITPYEYSHGKFKSIDEHTGTFNVEKSGKTSTNLN